jgi:hypothetical protein
MRLQRARPATLAFLLLLSPRAYASSRRIEKTVPLPADGRVTISTYKGSVHVTPWEKAEVSVDARIEPDTESECGTRSEEERWVERTQVNVRESSHRVAIESDYGDLSSHRFLGVFGTCITYPFVHYEIRLPRTASLEIKDQKSKIDVRDLVGDLDIDSYKGTVVVSGLDGSIRLNTYKGDAKVDVVRLARSSRAETYKGEITITLPKSAAFELDGRPGRRGDVRSDFDVTVRSRGRRRSDGDEIRGTINGGGPRLSLETYKGTVRLVAR